MIILKMINNHQFQSSLPRGSDPVLLLGVPAEQRISILAPSRERPEFSQWSYAAHGDFNPRSLAGATQQGQRPRTKHLISILAPSRERPMAWIGQAGAAFISILAPSRERPRLLTLTIVRVIISILAPSRERPSYIDFMEASKWKFQSSLPRGSDHCCCRLLQGW